MRFPAHPACQLIRQLSTDYALNGDTSGAEVRVRRTAVYQGAGAMDRDVRIAGRVAGVPEPGFVSSRNAAGVRPYRAC